MCPVLGIVAEQYLRLSILWGMGDLFKMVIYIADKLLLFFSGLVEWLEGFPESWQTMWWGLCWTASGWSFLVAVCSCGLE